MAFGVYVHVPFCHSKCGYCAFATTTLTAQSQPELVAFSDNVLRECQQLVTTPEVHRRLPEEPVTSLYFGGGTPSLLTVEQIESIIGGLDSQLDFASNIEVTMEVNPEGVTRSDLAGWQRAGVTRMSLGMQSIRPQVLTLLDRQHDPRDAITVASWAHELGIAHVSMDLIYGTPGERLEDLVASLDAVVASGVDHVSAYALSVEPGTKLQHRVATGELATPSSDTAAERYEIIDDYLKTHGFEWYEISNWARNSAAQSVHNLTYWHCEKWIGLGPSAHSRLGNFRWSTERNSSRWADNVAAGCSTFAESEVLTNEQCRHEELITRVRLNSGFTLTGHDGETARKYLLSQRWVETAGSASAGIESAGIESAGIKPLPEAMRLTRSGRLLADQVVTYLWDLDVAMQPAVPLATQPLSFP